MGEVTPFIIGKREGGKKIFLPEIYTAYKSPDFERSKNTYETRNRWFT